jgi:hypothetical protein
VVSIAVGQINSAVQLSDADGDTKIQVEESSDEDKIRFDTGGTERAQISANNLFLTGGTDARIQLGTGGAGAAQVSNNTVHIRGDGADMKLMAASGGGFLFETNGTEVFKIDSAGHVTKALQPAVRVGMSSSQLNLAANTEYVIQFNSEVFDVNADFDTSNYTFTAPVTGKYLVCASLRFQSLPTDINYMHGWIASSNGSRYILLFGSGADLFNAAVDYYRVGHSTIIDMDANDTFTIKVAQSGGTAQTDIGQESDLSVGLIS